MKGVPTDESLCAYLKEYRRGQENTASSRELEVAFYVGGTELRWAINHLHCDSHPICSANAGYFYVARRSEVRATAAQLTGCISKIAAATEGLLQSHEEAEEWGVAKKLDSIVELAAQKTREISADSRNYMAFLTTAAHNFKYNFCDQLLIYTQRPDTTVCAQVDFWNKHGRYVNRSTRGIALLVDTDQGYKLRYVFDMSDTNSRQGRMIPIWKMEPWCENAVIKALGNSYGKFPDRSGLVACLPETAKVIIEDNFGDYFTELWGVKEGSLLEELDDLNTETWFRGLVESSVAFIMLTRCGIDPMDYSSGKDLVYVYDFDTPETLSILGDAVNDIMEMPLREIASTVLNLCRTEQRENRTFAQALNRPYHDSRTKQERSIEHGTDISNGGRLPSAQSGGAGDPEDRKI